MTQTTNHPSQSLTITDTQADQALKAKHRAMWAMGDYPAVATEVIAPLGPTLVEAVAITSADDVLDIAAGSGNAAIPAALTGARVVASDLTPDLLETGRQQAERAGATLRWEQADAEALPYADGQFDAVISVVGVMFAPHHQQAADELLRVCRPGGRIGLISWTPSGFIGQMFATMKPFVPPPPPGAQPPPLWGDEQHVRELLGDRVTDVVARVEGLEVDRFADGNAFRDFFKRTYGPTIVAYRNIADDPERTAELDAALAELGDRVLAQGTMRWEYLLFTATRA
jgi:SAM-dependent methyltransferase